MYEVAKVSGGKTILIDGEAMPGNKVYLRLGHDDDLEGVEVSCRIPRVQMEEAIKLSALVKSRIFHIFIRAKIVCPRATHILATMASCLKEMLVPCDTCTWVQVGDLVWKTHDAEVEQRLRRSFEGLSSAEMRKVEVDVWVEGRIGSPLTLRLR